MIAARLTRGCGLLRLRTVATTPVAERCFSVNAFSAERATVANFGTARRCYATRFKNTKKARTEVLEKERPEYEQPPQQQQQQQGSLFGFGEQQQQQQQQQPGAPGSTFPSYVGSREREQEQQGSQWEALGGDVVAHMQKVYGTMAVGIGIAAGASMFTMATPLIGVHPMIPGLLGLAPLMGIMYTSNRTHSPAMRAGMFAAFCGLSGMSLAPLCYMAMKLSPVLVPQVSSHSLSRTRTHTPSHARTHAHAHTRTHARTHAHAHAAQISRARTLVRTHTHTQTYTHARTHALQLLSRRFAGLPPRP